MTPVAPSSHGFSPEIQAKLSAPFPNVKNDMMRPSDGFRPRYVEAVDIIQRLNEVLSGMWSFECGDPQWMHNQNQPSHVFVKGRLTIWAPSPQGYLAIVREQYGQCMLYKHQQSGLLIDPGSDLKAAATDAFKKCATSFGVCLDLYMNGETAMQGLQKMTDQPAAVPQPMMQTVGPQADPNGLVSPMTLTMLRNVLKRATGYTEQTICQHYQIQNLEALTEGVAIAIMTQIGGVSARAA